MEPMAEFQEELEFRAKVYKMLSMGLSHSEIERVLRKSINWSLFSVDTLEQMIEDSKNPIVVSLPKELFESSGLSSALMQKKIDYLEFLMRKSLKAQSFCLISLPIIMLLSLVLINLFRVLS